MQCPNGDGELASHTTHGEQALTVSYATCPTCRGYWMDSFAANFIRLPKGDEHSKPAAGELTCPVCTKRLIRATGDNIPDAVVVYRCAEGHGYFFPGGQLAAWKNAQTAKITYHKLWNIPLPSVASVLLAGLILFVLVGTLRERQITTSQAKELVKSQHAYMVPLSREVLIAVQTSTNAKVTIHIPQLSLTAIMETDNQKTHQYLLERVAPGSYTYWFAVETPSGNTIESDHFQFTMP